MTLGRLLKRSLASLLLKVRLLLSKLLNGTENKNERSKMLGNKIFSQSFIINAMKTTKHS